MNRIFFSYTTIYYPGAIVLSSFHTEAQVKMRAQEDPVTSFMRGSYRLLILAILERSVMHGYQILKRMEGLTGERPKISTLYSILKDMERSGLLRSKVEDTRRIYQLTEKGKSVLHEFRTQLGEGAIRVLELIVRRGNSPSP